MSGETHPGFWQTLVLVAPDDKVQEVGQVALAHVVPHGTQLVGDAVLMQRKHVEPAVLSRACLLGWPQPAQEIVHRCIALDTVDDPLEY